MSHEPFTAQVTYCKHKVSLNVPPVDAVLEKRLPPSEGAAKDAVVAVVPPRPRVKPVAAGC